jgi:4-hydroxy-tetrahydrodipicolinate reductase
MIRAILIGHGRMGQMIEQAMARAGDFELIGVVDVGLFEKPEDVPGQPDVLVDFSYPGNLDKVLEFSVLRGCPVVVGTTGYSQEQLALIRGAAKKTAVVHSSNYSTGVALLAEALKQVAPKLMDAFDVEIVETHHNKKADSPSGTAKLLVDAVDPDHAFKRVYGREGQVGARGREIGIHAVRGGTVAGEHRVIFYGEDEVLEFKHSATSRQIFVNGAVRAARFIVGKPAGLYTMADVMGEVRA